MRVSILYIANLIAAIQAFNITSPTLGQKLDPTQPITFSWTFNSTDPASFNIYLNQPGGLTSNVEVASDVSTFTGSYIISTSSVKSYGVGFQLIAESMFTGDVLAISPNFTLSMGSASSSTYTGSVTSGPASASASAAPSGSSTNTGAAATTGGSSESSSESSMTSATGSNSFTTSTVSRSGSSTGTSASAAASATSSHNAQPKLGDRSQMAFTAAGLIAGLAALMA